MSAGVSGRLQRVGGALPAPFGAQVLERLQTAGFPGGGGGEDGWTQ